MYIIFFLSEFFSGIRMHMYCPAGPWLNGCVQQLGLQHVQCADLPWPTVAVGGHCSGGQDARGPLVRAGRLRGPGIHYHCHPGMSRNILFHTHPHQIQVVTCIVQMLVQLNIRV